MQSPEFSTLTSPQLEPCCERNAEESSSLICCNKNLRINSSSSSSPTLHHLLTVETTTTIFPTRADNNGSSPTTPPSPLYKKNLSVDTTVGSSSSNENSISTAASTSTIEEATPSPTTANVRHNVLQKISKWSGLDNFGTPLEPTHIIPLKTPIKTKFLESAKKWRPFTTEDFLFGNLKSGYCVAGIVDLSNHDCIYDVDSVCSPKNPQQFLKEIRTLDFKDEAEKDVFLKFIITSPSMRKSCIYDNFTSDEIRMVIDKTETIPLTYIKVRLVAKEIPGVEQQVDFNHVINDFFDKLPSHYIGVHCSYGFNRTGFICCSYLISEKAIPIDEALNIFAKSKPPGIKHHWFLKALRNRYDPNYIEQNDDENGGISEDSSM